MTAQTPRTDAVEPDGVPEDVLSLCRQFEAALRAIAPFVLEDYYENCATAAFKRAVEMMKEALKK